MARYEMLERGTKSTSYRDNQLSQFCIKLKTGLISQKKKKMAVRFDKGIKEKVKRSGQEKK